MHAYHGIECEPVVADYFIVSNTIITMELNVNQL